MLQANIVCTLSNGCPTGNKENHKTTKRKKLNCSVLNHWNNVGKNTGKSFRVCLCPFLERVKCMSTNVCACFPQHCMMF